jgi:hypothetical protein
VADPASSTDIEFPVTATVHDRARLPVPRHALDMFVFALKNVDNPANFPVEVRINICSFFVQLSRHTSGDELNIVKEAVRPILVQLLEDDVPQGGQPKEEILRKAIQRLLDTWC